MCLPRYFQVHHVPKLTLDEEWGIKRQLDASVVLYGYLRYVDKICEKNLFFSFWTILASILASIVAQRATQGDSIRYKHVLIILR